MEQIEHPIEHLIHRAGMKDLQHLPLSRVYLDGDKSPKEHEALDQLIL